MHYKMFDAWLSEVIAKASDAQRMAFAHDTVWQVVDSPLFEQVDLPSELSEEAVSALLAAKSELFSASPEALKDYITIVDEGVLTDGDMALPLLKALQAIDAWASYLADTSSSDLYTLANTSVELIDYQVEAPLDDFLRSSEMKAEKERIAGFLDT